jgi:hypothetical protein
MEASLNSLATHWVWFGAVGSVLAVGWRYILSFSRLVGSKMVASIAFPLNDEAIYGICTDLYDWKLCYRSQRIARTLVNDRGYRGVEWALLEEWSPSAMTGGWVLYRKGWCFLLVRCRGSGQPTAVGETSVGMTFSWIRGTFDFDAWYKDVCAKVIRPRDNRSRTYVQGEPGQTSAWEQRTVLSRDYSYDDDFKPNYRLVSVLRQGEGGRVVWPSEIRSHRLYLNPAARRVVEYAKDWASSREWFHARGLAWKTGAVFYGPQGTGKTSLVRWLAEEIKAGLFYFDRLRFMTDGEFRKAWQQMLADRSSQIKIPLFEDFNEVFEGRRNIAMKPMDEGLERTLAASRSRQNAMASSASGEIPTRILGPGEVEPTPEATIGMRQPLAFQTLLQCFDGIETRDGVFIALTTNHVHKLDPALGGPDEALGGVCSTRPGRIDFAVELGYIDAEGRRYLAEPLLGGAAEAAAWVEQMAHLEEVTPAQWVHLTNEEAFRRRRVAERLAAETPSGVVLSGDQTTEEVVADLTGRRPQEIFANGIQVAQQPDLFDRPPADDGVGGVAVGHSRY